MDFLMTKSTFLLPAFIVMLSTTLLGCNSRTKNDLNLQENTLMVNKDIRYADQVCLNDIQNYRKETGKKIDSNHQKIAAYKVKIDNKGEMCKYDYRQSILKLQNSYMEMKLDEYEPEGKEKWEFFNEEYTSRLVELSKEFTGFSNSN
jgi:hypothetical protein